MPHVFSPGVMIVMMHRRLCQLTRIARLAGMSGMVGMVNRLSIGCWVLGVVRWAFLFFFNRHQFHPTLRTVTGVILHHFRMYDAGVVRLLQRGRRCLRKQRRMDCRD